MCHIHVYILYIYIYVYYTLKLIIYTLLLSHVQYHPGETGCNLGCWVEGSTYIIKLRPQRTGSLRYLENYTSSLASNRGGMDDSR